MSQSDWMEPIFLPRRAPHLSARREYSEARGCRKIRISRSSPPTGQGFPVGDLQVNIEDDKPENDNIHNEPASTSPPQPSHTPSEICVLLAALHREDPRRANAAFNDYRRTHPARAGELFSILVHGTMEQLRLGHFFYWELSARDDIAALDLLERSLRVHLGISQLPRPLDVRISIPCLLLIDGLQSLSMMLPRLLKELFKAVVRARG